MNELKKVIDFIEEIKAKVDTKLYNDGAIFEKQLMSAEEAEKLKDYMYENYDLKNKWNTTL